MGDIVLPNRYSNMQIDPSGHHRDSPYAHLLRKAAPGLLTAACVHFDDIGDAPGTRDWWALAVDFFKSCGASVRVVKASQANPNGLRRYRPRAFGKLLLTDFGGSILNSVEATDRAGSTVEDAHLPPTYSAARWSPGVRGMCFYSTGLGLDAALDWALNHVAGPLFQNTGAVYVFEYPLCFSPAAYFWGVGFSPNRASCGALGPIDMTRMTNWRDHVVRGRRASQGFLRDVYPVVLLRSADVEHQVERRGLYEWVHEGGGVRGQVSRHGDWSVWRIPDVDLLAVQAQLDRSRVLLSGFSPDESGIQNAAGNELSSPSGQSVRPRHN